MNEWTTENPHSVRGPTEADNELRDIVYVD